MPAAPAIVAVTMEVAQQRTVCAAAYWQQTKPAPKEVQTRLPDMAP